MKSLWQADSVCCAALNKAASRLSMTISRPLIPPDALHHAAKALACWTIRFRALAHRVGGVVEHGDVDCLRPHPADRRGAPRSRSQIFPSPGHSPLVDRRYRVRLADVAATAFVDETATNAPASMTVAIAIGNTIRRRPRNPLRSTSLPPRTLPRASCDRDIQSGFGSKWVSPWLTVRVSFAGPRRLKLRRLAPNQVNGVRPNPWCQPRSSRTRGRRAERRANRLRGDDPHSGSARVVAAPFGGGRRSCGGMLLAGWVIGTKGCRGVVDGACAGRGNSRRGVRRGRSSRRRVRSWPTRGAASSRWRPAREVTRCGV